MTVRKLIGGTRWPNAFAFGSTGQSGFGEAAQTYFGKDIRSLTSPEAATLASIVRGASYYNPYRHPDQVLERRNTVLSLMRQNGFITDREYAIASETPLQVLSGPAESNEAPYFVDLVNDELERRFPGYDFQAHSAKIYTTLDLNLQKAANEAVTEGMKQGLDIQGQDINPLAILLCRTKSGPFYSEALKERIKELKSRIHKAHNPIYNETLMIEIETLQWVLSQIHRPEQ